MGFLIPGSQVRVLPGVLLSGLAPRRAKSRFSLEFVGFSSPGSGHLLIVSRKRSLFSSGQPCNHAWLVIGRRWGSRIYFLVR